MGGERQDKQEKGTEPARDGAKEPGKAVPVDQGTQREAAEERKEEGGYD